MNRSWRLRALLGSGMLPELTPPRINVVSISGSRGVRAGRVRNWRFLCRSSTTPLDDQTRHAVTSAAERAGATLVVNETNVELSIDEQVPAYPSLDGTPLAAMGKVERPESPAPASITRGRANRPQTGRLSVQCHRHTDRPVGDERWGVGDLLGFHRKAHARKATE